MARNYYIAHNPLDSTKIAPSSLLDLILHPHKQNKKVHYHVSMLSYYNLEVVYELNGDVKVHHQALNDLIHTAIECFHKQEHPNTDHLIIKVTITDPITSEHITLVYVSLESSIRSVIAGVGFCTRLPNFKKLFAQLIDQGVSLFFFSEGCRDVVTKRPVLNDKGVQIVDVQRYWYSIRRELEDDLGLYFIGCAPNVAQGDGLSFGMEAYIVRTQRHRVLTWAPLQLSSEEGSGAMKVVVQLGAEQVALIGVHMPLDFKRGPKDNALRGALEGLRKHIDGYAVDLVFGDFNTIMWRYDLVKEILDNCTLIADDTYPTFFPSFCDAESKEKNSYPITDIMQ